MTIYDIETIQHEVPRRMPEPLDARIQGGIAIWGFLTQDVLDEVAGRLNQAFDNLREDESRGFGSCIAYTIGLHDAELEVLEDTLYQTAAVQNHGVLTQQDVSTQSTVWMGNYNGGRFFINRHEGNIVMDTGNPREGKIYSLLGQSAMSRFNEQ